MWRGESRGGLLLLLLLLGLHLLLHLPSLPLGETRVWRPWGAGRSGAPRPTAGRASGGARGPEEVRAGPARNRDEGVGGDSWRRRRPLRPRRRRTKGGLCARPGPKGPAEVRAARPRPLVPGGAASSSSSAARAPAPSCPWYCLGLPRRPPARRRGRESRAPHAFPVPGRCVFMNSINGALTAHTKPFLLLGRDGVGEGGPRRLERSFFSPKHRSFSLKAS